MEYIQLTLFGKTSQELSAQTRGGIFGEFSKRSQRAKFQCLNLENGQEAEWCDYSTVKSLGELSTPNIGESPNVENVSILSSVLEAEVPEKYYLTPKACQGILRRAQKRGKILPTLLKAALEAQADGKLLVTKIEGNQEVQSVGADIYNGRLTGDVAATITASTGSSATHSGASVIQAQIFDMSHASDVIRECGDKVPTLQNRMGTGGNQVPLVFEKTNIAETPTAYGICSQSSNAMKSSNPSSGFKEISVSKTLDENCCNPTCNSAVCHYIARLFRWVVRRLTPRECERLQGFPDDWTRYDTRGNEISDCHRYQALGNTIAIPCAIRVFKGIIDVESGYRRIE